MNRFLLIILAFILLIICYACPIYPEPEQYNYPIGHYPDSIANFEKVNSEFDDINMNYIPPEIYGYSALVFSSNRLSKGGQFDIVSEIIKYKWDKNEGVFSIENEMDPEMDPEFIDLENILQPTRSEFDEYGPTVIINNKGMFLLYSNNESGKMNVKFTLYNNRFAPFKQNYADSLIDDIYSVPFLSNPKFNEGYVTFHFEQSYIDQFYRALDDTNKKSLIYCSDSLGQYDIYSMNLLTGITENFFTKPNTNPKEYLTTINSDYNDRCPYINGNFMVFSSDRPGGFGGYDFYYSIFEDNEWSEPINFGSPINSEYNEYRAITLRGFMYQFNNDLLIFSSDRPGGKGGFDIYYTGIGFMPELCSI